MRKIYIGNISILFFILFFNTFSVRSQQVNTLYFMENVPVRNYLNPSFQPLTDFYLGLPLFGFSQFSVGNNSISLKDAIYKQNGQTIPFFDVTGNKQTFYNLLNPTLNIQANADINLLNFGFRTGKSYWNFSLTEKLDGQVGIPRDLFKLALFGAPQLYNNIFNFNNLGTDISLYTEVGLGYSRKFNDKFSVGAKLKFLYGTANVSSANQSLSLNTGVDQWFLNGQGTLNIASPGTLQLGNNFQSINYTLPALTNDWIKPIGMGAGIDIGFEFKPISNLSISAALTDFGFINWTQNVKNIDYKVDYTFNGFGSFNFLNSTINVKNITDSVLNVLSKATTSSSTSKAYTTYTSPKLNVGLEYAFFENKLSLGLLSRTIKYNDNYFEELTGSVNGRPANWVNLSLSYSILNGRMSTIGAGLGLRTGFINWSLSADYIPLYYANLPINPGPPAVNVSIPYNNKGLNFALGINFVFNYRKDSDHDGVIDKKDLCPDTPKGVKVDKNGCPIDSDGDGVPDYLDKCPNTPKGTKVDKKGCSLDSDGDGVPDNLDKCPKTPKGVKVDSVGCPIDADHDGIPDYMDKCPNTPTSVKVDSVGCPIDSDHDGVPDYLDKCPETPLGLKVDMNGCPEPKPEVKPEPKPVVKSEVKKEIKPVVNKQLSSLFQKAFQGIKFETGNDVILPISTIILEQIAGVLKYNPLYLIEIRGFTDNVGKPETNKKLSEKRAQAVKRYFVRKGVEDKRITAVGLGDTFPIADNKSASGRAVNRRVEFIVTYEEVILK
jgi:outer membrane protein OmpA-like peptidoglycan-associated protein